MHLKTHLAAAIAAALVFTAHAAPRWDDKTLAAARAKAEADIDHYLQHGSGIVLDGGATADDYYRELFGLPPETEEEGN